MDERKGVSWFAFFLAIGFTVTVLLVGYTFWPEPTPDGAVTVPERLPACATEDSTQCVWDSATQGEPSTRTQLDAPDRFVINP